MTKDTKSDPSEPAHHSLSMSELLDGVAACRLCEDKLPHTPPTCGASALRQSNPHHRSSTWSPSTPIRYFLERCQWRSLAGLVGREQNHVL